MAESSDSREDYGGELIETGQRRRRKFTRRDFVKLGITAGAFAGLGSVGVLSAMGILKGPQEPVPAWQMAPGVVDYSKVPRELAGPTPNVLKVAQWFNYWPGKFISDFEEHMQKDFGLNVKVQVSIFTSNEELFTWITLGRQKFDVFFPSNYVVDLMKNGGMVYNVNTAWLPNFTANVAVPGSEFVGVPRDRPFDMRNDPAYAGDPLVDPADPLRANHYVSVPYLWGTTGLGWRKDRIPRADVEAHGCEFFWMDQFTPSDPTYPTLQLNKKMRMLEDERDVISWGLKKAGWEDQATKGMTPTGVPKNPDAPFNGEYQWTSNETDPSKVDKAGDFLFSARGHLFDFNSTEAPTSLVSDAAVINQVWSGDLMYARRPDQSQSLPIDYIIPKQGSTWWIDCAAIHSKSRNLWLAHEFIDFIHQITPTNEHDLLVKYNIYSTPNKTYYDLLWQQEHSDGERPIPPTPIFPSGWIMSEDPILYPNKFDPEGFKRLDMSSDVGLDVLTSLYNPLWFELTSG